MDLSQTCGNSGSAIEKEDKFYQLCNRYKPRMRMVIKRDYNDNIKIDHELESTGEPVFPVTEEDIRFAKSWLDDMKHNVNHITIWGSYFHVAAGKRHFELAQLIISHNNRFDFQLLTADNGSVLWSLCVYDQLELLKTIIGDPRFDGTMLNIGSNSYNNRTVLHNICSNDKLACDTDLIKMVVNNGKFTCLNVADDNGETPLMRLCYLNRKVANLDTIKLITEHKNFDVKTLVFGTKEQGCTPVTLSLNDYDIFMYFLGLVERNELLSDFNVKRSLFARDAYGYSVFDSVAIDDSYYTVCCELIKFVEQNSMRNIVWDDVLKVKIRYTGKKVFKLLKEYRLRPDATIDKLINNTYDHDYEPNYFLDFPKEAFTKVTDWYIYGKR